MCWTWSTSIATPTPSSAPPRWRGPRRRCSFIISASTPTRRASFNASRATCSTPIRGCVRRPKTIRRGCAGPDALWAQGISGDIPVVLVQIDDIEDIAIVGQLLRAHEYWRMKQLAVDLVILNERSASYVQDLQTALETMVRTSQSRRSGRRRTGRAARYSCCAPISSRARRAPCFHRWPGWCWPDAVAACRTSSIAFGMSSTPPPPPPRRLRQAGAPPSLPATPDLEFFNGLGGFAADGREYVTILGAGTVDAGAVDERHRQRRVRFSGRGRGRRLYLVGQQPRKPADALVERSRDRSAGRGRSFCATRIAASSGDRPRCRSGTNPRPMSSGTARDTAGSSMKLTASRSISSNMSRSMIRSKSRA